MNEHIEHTLEELKDSEHELKGEQERPSLSFGPGRIAMAIPDRGHAAGLCALEFQNATAFNKWATENPRTLVCAFETRGDVILILYGVLDSKDTVEEKRVATIVAENALEEFRKKRAEREAEEQKVKDQQAAADDACRTLGRLCVEKHSAFIGDLPGLSKLKNVRRSIADDIVQLIENHRSFESSKLGDLIDSQLKGLDKILKKYVKDGA